MNLLNRDVGTSMVDVWCVDLCFGGKLWLC
jgi:hypothetical protein